jgi:hypothetical protein
LPNPTLFGWEATVAGPTAAGGLVGPAGAHAESSCIPNPARPRPALLRNKSRRLNTRTSEPALISRIPLFLNWSGLQLDQCQFTALGYVDTQTGLVGIRRYAAGMEPPIVRIPRELLRVQLDDLTGLGVSEQARSALRGLLADLPLVPDAALSAQLIGPRQVALPCLAVLARHVGQGLRDHNLSLAHDRARLRVENRKLAFLDADSLAAAPSLAVAVLFVVDCTPQALEVLTARESANRASFITTETRIDRLNHWHTLKLTT